MWVKIDGIWKKAVSAHAKIGKEWHDAQIFSKSGGKWDMNDMTLNIKGIKIVYRLAPMAEQYNPLTPHLFYNPNLPARFFIGGESSDYNFHYQGVTLRYWAHSDYEEGVQKYKGSIYLVLENGREFEISRPNELDPIFDGMKIDFFGLGFTQRDGDHRTLIGWNSILTDEQHLKDTIISKDEYYTHIINGMYPFDPTVVIGDRPENYQPYLDIGIARNTSRVEYNMLGTQGFIDQTIFQVRLNNVPIPFLVVIQNEEGE